MLPGDIIETEKNYFLERLDNGEKFQKPFHARGASKTQLEIKCSRQMLNSGCPPKPPPAVKLSSAKPVLLRTPVVPPARSGAPLRKHRLL